MFVRVGRDGTVLESQASLGEEECKLTVALQKNGYYFFAEGEEILGVVPVPCGGCRVFLAPQVSVEKQGARVAFCNVNGRPLATEFCALVVLRATEEVHHLPSVEEVYRKLRAATTGNDGTPASDAAAEKSPSPSGASSGQTASNGKLPSKIGTGLF